jgi:hypothetical protein
MHGSFNADYYGLIWEDIRILEMNLGHLYPFIFSAFGPKLIVLNLFIRVEPCQ